MKTELIRNQLKSWFQTYKRDLPWRRTHDPYLIWLSEVILQQTRIDQGLPYYRRFAERFPTIADLAQASEEEVLKMWQGLGYYNRARNLHKTAQVITRDYQGEFPKDYPSLLSLKGIGEYTASAIASMAFDLPYPVVDGNVNRVIARLYGIQEPVNTTSGKKAIKAKAENLLDKKAPGNFNEALMDFGAIQCTSVKPKCGICPLQTDCYAFQHNQTAELPYKAKKLKRRTRYFYYLVLANENGLVLRQRGTNDVWQHLFDFPLIEYQPGQAFEPKDLLNFVNNSDNWPSYVGYYKHVLTHQDIIASFYKLNIFDLQSLGSSFIFIEWKDLENYPVPRLIDRFLKDNMEELMNKNLKK